MAGPGQEFRVVEMVAATERSMGVPNARSALVRLCAAGFLAYCSYAICRTPLLPLFARELGADAPLVGFVVGASTLTGIFLKLPAGAWSDILGRRTLLIAGALVFATLPFLRRDGMQHDGRSSGRESAKWGVIDWFS